MKRVAWLTDIHLNFLRPAGAKSFCRRIVAHEPDVVLVGGDIGDANTLCIYLQILEDELRCPTYFVLGNHDFYHGSIAKGRTKVEKLADCSDNMHWLPAEGLVELTAEKGLIGIDSWADGRLGDYDHSHVMLNDYLLIEELSGIGHEARRVKLNELGDAAAANLEAVLPEALERFKHVILLTHVPPFSAACRHAGRIADDNWLPHFSCKAVGDVLMKLMRSHPLSRLTVLCGHTHDEACIQVLPNLLVKTGGADYGQPRLQELLMIR